MFDRQRRLSNYKLFYREEPYELKFEAVVWMPSGIKDMRSPSHQITMSNVLVKLFIFCTYIYILKNSTVIFLLCPRRPKEP